MAKKLTATQKLRRSLQAKVRRLEKKGEYVPQEVKQKIKESRYQTLASMRRDKFSNLRDEIKTAVREESWEPLSGYNSPFHESDAPYQGDIVYQNVMDTIDTYPSKGAEALEKAIIREIRKYGREAVARSMANAGEELVSVAKTIAVYTESAEVIHSAMVTFFDIINGSMYNNSDSEYLGELMDEMTDMGYES